MASFTLLNKDKEVLQVVVVDDKDCLDENNQESEAAGIAFLEKLFQNHKWIIPKTAEQLQQEVDSGLPFPTQYYNNSELEWKKTIDTSKQNDGFRKNPAGIGFKYDQTLDAFVPPKPADPDDAQVEEAGEFILNEEKAQWEFSGTLKTAEIPIEPLIKKK